MSKFIINTVLALPLSLTFNNLRFASLSLVGKKQEYAVGTFLSRSFNNVQSEAVIRVLDYFEIEVNLKHRI